jgi:hypothetical protein
MRATVKYVGLGLIIGMAGTALVGTAAFFALPALTPPSPTPTAAATLTASPTPLPTFTPSPIPPTATPLPSLTPSPVPPTATLTTTERLIADGSLHFAGPLSNVEQIRLYEASLKYIATTSVDSHRMSKDINGVGYGDPDNICGPLAAAILRDAGVLPPETVPHDFWLLDPLQVSGQQVLRASFPAAQYDYTRTTTPINKMDWNTFPLVPGDFLFLWHGSWGNFDHMLVVTRVDKELRTYAVTNYGTQQDGFIINEAMLYDPNDPSAGLFHTWTRERDAILGSTGFGGFELWRPRVP